MLCNIEFAFLPMLVSNVKNQSEFPKSLLVGGHCLDRAMFCLKLFDFNDFSLKLTKYLMISNSYFCEKKMKSSYHRKHKPSICSTSLPLKLTKYLMISNSYFCEKKMKSSYHRKHKPSICSTSLPRALQKLVAVNQTVDQIL